MKRQPNFIIYVDGMGFLTETNRPDYFFVECLEEARTLKKRDAIELSAIMSDEFKKVHILKKCGTTESYN